MPGGRAGRGSEQPGRGPQGPAGPGHVHTWAGTHRTPAATQYTATSRLGTRRQINEHCNQ